MALRILRTCEPNFEENFAAFMRRRAEAQGLLGGPCSERFALLQGGPDSPQRKVQEIIEAVRARGDVHEVRRCNPRNQEVSRPSEHAASHRPGLTRRR